MVWLDFFTGALACLLVLQGVQMLHERIEVATRIRAARIRSAWMAARHEGA